MIECPEPTPGPNEVKIRVERTGICGTDLHIEAWDAWAASAVNAPLIIGHEFSGRIVELGSDVTSLEVGTLVSGEGHVICGTCRNCRAGRRHMCKNTSSVGVNRNGAFAEYVVIPARTSGSTRLPLTPSSARSSIHSAMRSTLHSLFRSQAKTFSSPERVRSD